MGLVTGPHTRTPPHPQPVGSGPRQPAQKAGSRGWESAQPRTLHTQARGAPPPGTLMLPPQRAKPARKSARCGVGDGFPRPHPLRTHSQWVVGPGSPPTGRAVGGGRAPDPGRPTPRQEAPPRAPSCRPHSAQSQLARARAVGLVTGPHTRIPLLPQPVGSGPRQPAQRAGSRGWESARPRTPNTGAGGALPWAPSCRPHSAQSQLARARAVGFVTGPQARTTPHPQPVGSGPVGGGTAHNTGRPTPRQEAPPPGRPRAAPKARKASSKERALWGW